MEPRRPSEVAARLRELGNYLRLYGESPFRARAYETAATSVEALGARFAPLLAEDRLTEVPGIGSKLAATIHELAATGTTATLERWRAEMPPGLLPLVELPGITLPRLRVLHETLGITDREELRQAASTGVLREVRGFGARTVAKLLAALDRPIDTPREMLLLHARVEGARLHRVLAEIPGVASAEVAGAVRRWKELVRTLRLVAASRHPGAALDSFLASAGIGEMIERGPHAGGSAVGERARFRLFGGAIGEIELVTPAFFIPALIRQTGSGLHVAQLEERAAARRVSFWTTEARTEADFYRTLDLPFIPPELRDDPADLARAAAGDDFSDLVTLADIQGYVHCHTTASDGRDDLGTMAEAAVLRGMKFLTITDHSPSASYAGGLSAERLIEQAREIARLRPAIGLDILAGTESDIRADGSLDYDADVLTQLDVVIASIHNRFGMDEPAMTERLVTAMRQPVFKIWGHGLGRLLLHRAPIACRVEEVLDAAAAGRAAIEINGDPHRLDLAPEWLRQARARGLCFVVSVDAHSVRDFDHLEYGVHLARRAGIRKREVLNARSPTEFRAAVAPRA